MNIEDKLLRKNIKLAKEEEKSDKFMEYLDIFCFLCCLLLPIITALWQLLLDFIKWIFWPKQVIKLLEVHWQLNTPSALIQRDYEIQNWGRSVKLDSSLSHMLHIRRFAVLTLNGAYEVRI